MKRLTYALIVVLALITVPVSAAPPEPAGSDMLALPAIFPQDEVTTQALQYGEPLLYVWPANGAHYKVGDSFTVNVYIWNVSQLTGIEHWIDMKGVAYNSFSDNSWFQSNFSMGPIVESLPLGVRFGRARLSTNGGPSLWGYLTHINVTAVLPVWDAGESIKLHKSIVLENNQKVDHIPVVYGYTIGY